MKQDRLRELRATARWRAVEEAQNTAFAEIAGELTTSRMCPFCCHKLAELTSGIHYPEVMRCPSCGETVVLPKVVVRIETPIIVTDAHGRIVDIEE